MKKRTALILIMCIMAVSLIACKDNKKETSTGGNTESGVATSESNGKDGLDDTTGQAGDDKEQGGASVDGVVNDVAPKFDEVTLEVNEEKDLEGLLIEDNDTFCISLDGIKEAFRYPQAVTFSCMNKGEHHIAIAVSALSVNGCALGNQISKLWENEEGEFAILYPEEIKEKYGANGIKTVRFMLTAYFTGDDDLEDPEAQEPAFCKKMITIVVKDSKETEVVDDTENLIQVYEADYVNVNYHLQDNNNRIVNVKNNIERPIYINFSDINYTPSYSEYPVESRIIYNSERMYWDEMEQGAKMHYGSYMILPGDCTEIKIEIIDSESTEINNVTYSMEFSYADSRYADAYFNAVEAVNFGEKLLEVNVEEF